MPLCAQMLASMQRWRACSPSDGWRPCDRRRMRLQRWQCARSTPWRAPGCSCPRAGRRPPRAGATRCAAPPATCMRRGRAPSSPVISGAPSCGGWLLDVCLLAQLKLPFLHHHAAHAGNAGGRARVCVWRRRRVAAAAGRAARTGPRGLLLAAGDHHWHAALAAQARSVCSARCRCHPPVPLHVKQCCWVGVSRRAPSTADTYAKRGGRSAHTAVAFRDRFLLVFAGGSMAACFADLHALDARTMTWSQPPVTGATPSPRAGAAACAWLGLLWPSQCTASSAS